MKLDDLDMKLILELQRNGRQSFVELARKLRASEITIRRRIKHLTERNIIHIAALPDLNVFGYGFTCLIGLQVRLADFDATANQLASYVNVCYLAKTTGRYDLMAVVVSKSSQEFADFVQNAISYIPGVLRTETFVNLNIYKGQAVTLDTSHLINGLVTQD